MASCAHSYNVTSKAGAMEDIGLSDIVGTDEEGNVSRQKGQLSLQQRFRGLEIFQRPMSLVFTNDKMNLEINEIVLDQISRINVPISVVGIYGVCRTGKSYLMNVLAGRNKGFPIGNYTEPETKGIWAWCQPHPTICDRVVIYLDTEGLLAAGKPNAEHDTKLFCLTMLMSSILIYNIKGVINSDALERLSVITKITEEVRIGGSNCSTKDEEKDAFQFISPVFMLCLRDFFFEYDGKTPDQYMETCLEESPNKDDALFNTTRRSIKEFFPIRKCFTLAQPGMNVTLRSLETQPKENISQEFWNDVELMTTFLRGEGPKLVNNASIHCWYGNTFKSFLDQYIKQITTGQKMDFASTLTQWAFTYNEQLKDTVCSEYQSMLDTLPEQFKGDPFKYALQCMRDLLKQFRRDAYPLYADKLEDKAAGTMSRMMESFLSGNKLKVKDLCYDYLKNTHAQMLTRNKTKYDGKDGYRKYNEDFAELLQKYDKEFENYEKEGRGEALQEFHTKTIPVHMYHHAKLQDELDKYERALKSQSRRHEEMIRKMEKEINDLKEQKGQKNQKIFNAYAKRLFTRGFFKRLQYLFTGEMDPIPLQDEENRI